MSAVNDENWRTFRACAGLTDLFYPEVVYGALAKYDRDVATAKFTCSCLCPVQNRCLLTAYYANEKHGVWGGIDWQNTRERRAARRMIKRRLAEIAKEGETRAVQNGDE